MPEDLAVDRAGGVHAAPGLGDLFGLQGSFGDPETVAAVIDWSRHTEPAAIGDRAVKLGRKFVFAERPVLFVEVVPQSPVLTPSCVNIFVDSSLAPTFRIEVNRVWPLSRLS